MLAPPLACPRVSPGPDLGRGAGVGLRGTPRVRGVRGRELPPLPVVPERPRRPPPPPYCGAAPAGPRPAPAHWLRRARSRLRGPGAATDPFSALCLPLARHPPPLSAPHAPPALPALRTAPRASRSPSSRNRPPRRPAPDRGRDRSWRTRAAGLGAGASPGGDDWGRGTNGAPDEALAAEKITRRAWAFRCLHFPAPWALRHEGPAGAAPEARPASPCGSHAPSGAESSRRQGRLARPHGRRGRWQGRPGTRSGHARLRGPARAAGGPWGLRVRSASATSPQRLLLAPRREGNREPAAVVPRGCHPKALLWRGFEGFVTPRSQPLPAPRSGKEISILRTSKPGFIQTSFDTGSEA